MAKNLYFSRDSKLYVEFDGAVWQVPVLDGFSFSQSTNASEITLSEMQNSSGLSRRGRRVFTDSLAPAEWSFSTYVRPYISASEHSAVEAVLWALMAGADNYASGDFTRATNIDSAEATGKVFTPAAGKADLVFTQSNRSTLGTANFYFVMNTDPAYPMVYKLTAAAVNEASIDFEVDGIATINWSGNAATIIDMQSAGDVTVASTAPTAGSANNGNIFIDSDTGAFNVGIADVWVEAIATGVTSTNTFIRNRLTQLLIDSADTTTFPGAGAGVYNMTITGGNITITNNITYLVPEEIGKVNVPIEHVTGARSVTGSFTCYLTFDTASNGGTSSDFFNDLTSTAGLNKVVNDFDVTFQIGGSTASTPRLYVKIPKCHIEVPNHSIEDVISIETNFSAYTTDFGVANEVSLEYYGVTV